MHIIHFIAINFVAQVKILFEGQGKYDALYNTDFLIITDKYYPKNEVLSNKTLVLKSLFKKLDNVNNHTTKVYFTVESLLAPNKSKLNEKVTGKNIVDLAILALKYLKSAIDFTEEFINDGEFPPNLERSVQIRTIQEW